MEGVKLLAFKREEREFLEWKQQNLLQLIEEQEKKNDCIEKE